MRSQNAGHEITIRGFMIMLQLSLQTLQRLAEFDARLFLGINRLHRHLPLEKLVRGISFTGDGHFYIALAIVLPLLYPEEGADFLMAGLLSFLMELPLYWLLKRSLKRRRPFHVVQALAPLLKPSDEFSFPSGHTTAAFMMAALVGVFFPAALLPMVLWASLIGLSRVMLRVHFISDVLAGIVLGTTIAMLSLFILG